MQHLFQGKGGWLAVGATPITKPQATSTRAAPHGACSGGLDSQKTLFYPSRDGAYLEKEGIALFEIGIAGWGGRCSARRPVIGIRFSGRAVIFADGCPP
jgi:hypothetical protein